MSVIYKDYTKQADKNPQQCYLEKNDDISILRMDSIYESFLYFQHQGCFTALALGYEEGYEAAVSEL